MALALTGQSCWTQLTGGVNDGDDATLEGEIEVDGDVRLEDEARVDVNGDVMMDKDSNTVIEGEGGAKGDVMMDDGN